MSAAKIVTIYLPLLLFSAPAPFLRLLLAVPGLIVSVPRIRLQELWGLVRRSVGGGRACLVCRLMSSNTLGTGEPQPPRCRLRLEARGLSLALQLRLRSMHERLFDVSCLVPPRWTGSVLVTPCPRHGRSSRTLANMAASHYRRSEGKLRCGGAAPRSLTAATPQYSSTYREAPP